LEFNVPLQHKYGYIRHGRSVLQRYPYPVKEDQAASDILISTIHSRFFVQ